MTTHNFAYRPEPGFRTLYIVGAGGHGREVAWLAAQSWGARVQIEFLVSEPKYLSGPVGGCVVRLIEEAVPAPQTRFVAALGDGAARRRMVEFCTSRGLSETTLVHPRCEMSESVEIGAGSVVCAGVICTVNVTIGRHVHVNVGCAISHDVVIGDYATLSPGVRVSGHVRIGRDVFIGSGATIINGSAKQPLCIGDGAIIAAGACVTREVEAHTMVAGIPAMRKR